MQCAIIILLVYQIEVVFLSHCPFSEVTEENQFETESGEGPDLTQKQCDSEPVGHCNTSRYRSLDGTCNNLERPAWGASNTPYSRFLNYNYGDGISEISISVTGKELPPPRNLSLLFFTQEKRNSMKYNLYALMWGQIIAHDMSFGSGVSRKPDKTIKCCQNGILPPGASANSFCAPIRVFPDDPFLGPFGIECYNFRRTDTTSLHGCSQPNVPTEQLNAVTAFLDASLVYSVSIRRAAALREMSGGRLKTTVRDGKVWPPQVRNPFSSCRIKIENEPCYAAGDPRVNQNTHLTALQVILVREHNRIADALASINPHWDDETIYQESRRILIAELQHIHYYEYLPTLLGFDKVVKEKLIHPGATGYVNDYDPEIDPSVMNEFTTTAFRYPHNEIRGMLKTLKDDMTKMVEVRISDWFNRPIILEIGNFFNGLLRGLTHEKSGFSDQFWDHEMTQYLFRGDKEFGEDLSCLDMQRSRGHGIGSYVEARAACGLSVPNSFTDMLDHISPQNVKLLKSIYECPADVDLYVGGSLERPVLGSKSGPTFTCILTVQFRRTRIADRYFYENGEDPEIRFKLNQLNSIRAGASAARLFCDNSDDIKHIQRKAFVPVSVLNSRVPCKTLPAIDLQLWKDD